MMERQSRRLVQLLVARFLLHFQLQQFCHGFVVVDQRCAGQRSSVVARIPIGVLRATTKTTSVLLSRRSSDNDDGDDGDSNAEESMNVEEARRRLESLLLGGGSTTTSTSNDNTTEESASLLSLPVSEWKKEPNKNPPLLTSIGRERMETEIALLESLAESDDAIPELWNLWYNARGPGPAKDLMQTETLVAQGQPEGWAKAEELLRQLIAREGIHWAEPVNRLATLLFLQSRYEESFELCKLVLQLKPWHFGALSGIVMVCQGLQDNEGMLEWARKRIPPLPKKEEKELEQQLALGFETRQQWVDRMLDRARAALLRGEMDLEEAFVALDKQDEMAPSSSRSINGSNRGSETKSRSYGSDGSTQNKSANSMNQDAKNDDDEEDEWQ